MVDFPGLSLSHDGKLLLSERKPRAMRGPGTQQLHAKLGDNTSARHILVLSDSNGEGYGVSKDATQAKAWISNLQRQLRSMYDPMGPDDNATYYPAAHGSYPSGSETPNPIPVWVPAYVYSGTVTDVSITQAKLSGFGFRAVEIAGGTTNFITFTVTGSDFEIYYASGTTLGTFKVFLDGTLLGTTCNTSRGSGGVGARSFSTGLTGLVYGSHTIKIQPNTTGDTIRIEGVKAYNNGIDAGVHVWDGSHGGFRAFDFLNAPTGAQSQFTDVFNTTDTLPGGKAFDYVLLALGSNEMYALGGLATPTGGRTAANYAVDLDGMISFIVAAGYTGGFGIVFPPVVPTKTDSAAQPWREAAWGVAVNRTNVDFIDLSNSIPNLNGSSAAPLAITRDADNIHYNDRGAAWVAHVVGEAIVPKTGRVAGVGTRASQFPAGNDVRLQQWQAKACTTVAGVTLSGTGTHDGVSCGVGDHILVVNHGFDVNNGPFIVQSGAWTRPPEWPLGSVLQIGWQCQVAPGAASSANPGLWVNTNLATVGSGIPIIVRQPASGLTFGNIALPRLGGNSLFAFQNFR